MKFDNIVNNRIEEYASKTKEEVRNSIGVTKDGRASSDVEKYREAYGANIIVNERDDTFLYRLRRAFVNPFSMVLLVMAAISFVADIFLETESYRGMGSVAIILAMLLASGVVRLTQELKAKRVSDHLEELVNTTVRVKRDGNWQELSSEELVVGDVVRLDAGDRVPADIRLLKVRDFFVSQAVITGESGIVEKFANPLKKEPEDISDYKNTVFMGSTVTGGKARGVVLAVGKDTLYGGLSPKDNKRKKSFDYGEKSIAQVLLKFVAIFVPIVFIFSVITKGDWLEAFLFAISIAVGLVPEMLPMVISACLAKGSRQMGQKQTIVKNINAMQAFGGMDVLCVDKTGTLTGDVILLEYYMDVLGRESKKTLDYGYLNSHYHTGVSNHLDNAVLRVRSMMEEGDEYYTHLTNKHIKLDEIPFEYSRKIASVLLQTTQGNRLIVKGDVTQVVSRCKYVEFQENLVEITDEHMGSVKAIVEEMYEDGMKVIAVAYKDTDKNSLTSLDESDLVLLGYLAFFDAPKQSAAEAIAKLQELHIDVKVLTGDNDDVASSVCGRLGIDTSDILSGADLDDLDDNEQPVRIENCQVFAELSPKQKSQIVASLQDNGHTVGFLGDGMNDLPAIIQADVGVSVDTATDAVKEAADVVLLKKDLNVLNDGVVEGRKAFANMSKYIRITASSNFGNVCAIVVASLLLPFFPMTALQLLLLNFLYDILCLVLPWDKVDFDVLDDPIEWSGKTLSRYMKFFGPISTVFDLITFAFLYFCLCPAMCGGSYDVLDAAGKVAFVALFQTGWFLESMWSQVLIIHLLRSKHMPFVHSNSSVQVIVVTILGVVLFTALTVTGLGAMVGLTAMPAIYYYFLAAAVILYLFTVTVAKHRYLALYGDLK